MKTKIYLVSPAPLCRDHRQRLCRGDRRTPASSFA